MKATLILSFLVLTLSASALANIPEKKQQNPGRTISTSHVEYARYNGLDGDDVHVSIDGLESEVEVIEMTIRPVQIDRDDPRVTLTITYPIHRDGIIHRDLAARFFDKASEAMDGKDPFLTFILVDRNKGLEPLYFRSDLLKPNWSVRRFIDSNKKTVEVLEVVVEKVERPNAE